MRTTSLLILGAAAIAALALGAAPEASAAPFGAPPTPLMADVYIGFGYGGHCAPRYVRRTYYRPAYTYPRTYYYRPYAYPRSYYYRPYAYPRVSLGFGYHSYPRYHRHHHHYRGHHGHYVHHGSRRVIGRRR